MPDRWYLDPDDTLEYSFDFAPLENGTGDSNWLDRTSSPIESIDSATVTSQDSPGVTVVSYSIMGGTQVLVKLSASQALAGGSYRVLCQITTSANQTKSKTATVFVTNQ